MKSGKIKYALIALGILLLAGGLILTLRGANLPRTAQIAAYVCIGVGCGLFGHGMGEVVSARARRADPEGFRQKDIETKDERNIALANRSKAKAFDVMTFVFGALMIAFALMGVDTAALLLLVFAYLFVHGCVIYYRSRLEKEM